jgi:hypothetical protein
MELIDLFLARDGVLTAVHLVSGDVYSVWNIAWGYDFGDECAHLTTNISPSLEGVSIDFFSTEDIDDVTDPADGTTLWQRR